MENLSIKQKHENNLARIEVIRKRLSSVYIDRKDNEEGELQQELEILLKEVEKYNDVNNEIKETTYDLEISKERVSQADKIVDLVFKNSNVSLFCSDLDEPFISFPVKNHKEYWSCKDKHTKSWIGFEFWNKYNKSPNLEAISTALNIIQGKATFCGEKITLANRVAFQNGDIFYSLSNDNWESVHISKDGWQIENSEQILFRRHTHQISQVNPERSGDVRNIFKYINVKNEEHQMLFLVWLISCFIPDFPHPILYIYGPQGSAKSTASRLIKKITDPSKIETFEIPKDQKELIQKLSHHWCLMFDNVSYISQDLSDILCRAVTGSGFSKRELYSDDSDVIYTFKRCISVNGVNLLALKPDLLERSILIELDRVSKTERKNEQDINKDFNRDLPGILGSIMDVLVSTLKGRSSVELKEIPRMADFALWGFSIAEALGYKGTDFMDNYFHNINLQHEEVVNENPIASFILSFMKDKVEWVGSATELLTIISPEFINNKKDIPKNAQALSHQLNIIKTNLEEYGIKIERVSGQQRKIIIRKEGEKTALIALSLNEEDEDKSISDQFDFL